MNFKKYYYILKEQSNYGGNAYQLLASIGIYPNKTYNFYDEAKKWYMNNTELTPEEINFTINAKMKHALGDNMPFFRKIENVNKKVLLTGPQEFDVEVANEDPDSRDTIRAVYDHSNNKMYVNPYIDFTMGELIQTFLHELVHSVQKVGNPSEREDSRNKLPSLFNPNTNPYTFEGDSNIIKGPENSDITSYGLKYYTKIGELDTILAEVNRIVAKLQNVMIYPNDIESAENALKYVIDPKNYNKIPNEFKESVTLLRAIIGGEGKSKPNSPQEQNRLIKSMAQRLSLLVKSGSDKNTDRLT
jgi:hypothetical protein